MILWTISGAIIITINKEEREQTLGSIPNSCPSFHQVRKQAGYAFLTLRRIYLKIYNSSWKDFRNCGKTENSSKFTSSQCKFSSWISFVDLPVPKEVELQNSQGERAAGRAEKLEISFKGGGRGERGTLDEPSSHHPTLSHPRLQTRSCRQIPCREHS